MNLSRTDKIVFLTTPILATILALLLKTDFLVTSLLFYLVPAIYISIKLQDRILKSLVFTIILLIPLTFVIYGLGVFGGAWHVPTTSSNLFLGFIALQDVVWALVFVYLVVMLYQYTADKGNDIIFPKKLWYLCAIVAILLVALGISWLANDAFIVISFAYVAIGVAFVLVPIVLFSIFRSTKSISMIPITIYLAIVNVLYEFVGLTLDLWSFPGAEFLGYIPFFSHSLPIEEFVFFILLAAPAIIVFFKTFDT